MIVFMLAAASWAADLTLDVEAVGGVVTMDQQTMLQTTLERAADFLEADLGVNVVDRPKVKVFVYANPEDYDEERTKAGMPSWATGFFRSQGTSAVAHLQATTPDIMRRAFLHEGTHYLMSTQRTPRWLNEGLASVLEGGAVSGNTLMVTPPPRFSQVLADTGRPTATDVVTSTDKWLETSTEEAGLLYVSGWALTASLLQTTEGRATLSAVLAAYKKSPTPKAVLAAMEDSYPGGMDGLEAAFAKWTPPSSMIVNSPIAVEVREDPMWVSCGDGRLVLKEAGCGK